MKDRLREAIFNLVGPSIRGAHALDLFAGTGALALEALSRGADRATLIEQHNPTANVIRQNVAELGVDGQAEVVVGNVFIWWKRQSWGDSTSPSPLGEGQGVSSNAAVSPIPIHPSSPALTLTLSQGKGDLGCLLLAALRFLRPARR